jgi:hypothetical protein
MMKGHQGEQAPHVRVASRIWTRNGTASTKPGMVPVTGHWVRHQGPGIALIQRGDFGMCQTVNPTNTIRDGGLGIFKKYWIL